MIEHVTIERFAELSGYTPDAIEKKIERGVWLEGREYVRAPDGRRLIKLTGYDAWAEGQACAPQAPSRSKSTSATKASAVVSDFASRRQRQILSTPPDSKQP